MRTALTLNGEKERLKKIPSLFKKQRAVRKTIKNFMYYPR